MSSSTEIWRHLPLLFQRSCLTFGRTCTVIEQLKSSSNKKLTSLRLVGVEGTVNIEALSEALQQNTTLQQVSIGGNFLQTLSLSSPGTQNGILKLFQAIGCLPNLTQVTLQGNEDSEPFPVEALTLLVETNNTRGGKCLEEINCHYVDFLVSTPSAMTDLSQALKECTSLKRVKLLSLDLIASHTTTTSATATRLDPLVACLSHCQEVEIGLRHRRPESNVISQRALQSLLSPSGNLQKLTLKRRISLNAQHLAAILQCLSHASCPLQQLQLDEINLQPTTTTTTTYSSSTLWDDLATMLGKNSTLEVLDLNFAANTSSSGRMDHKAVLAITQALRVNQSVQHLSLLGALEKCNAQAWLDLLEHYNFTLQELELSMEDSSNSNNGNNVYDQQRLQFYLDLNRQPVAGTSCGLRSILRDCNGAIPRNLMQPCVEAALQVGRSAQDDATDDDDEDDHWDNTIRSPPASSTTLGLSALFYLLQQQPALVSALQQHMLTWEEVVAQRRLLEEKKRKAQLEDGMESKAYIPLGGASPQLLLLDDDIVALW